MIRLLFLPVVFSLQLNTSLPFFPYTNDLFSEDSQISPLIVRHSHFSQTFRLGYKLILSCEAEGNPRPTIIWYKNGAEIIPFKTIHIRDRLLSLTRIRSFLDIDPTSLSDKATYGCLASNPNGFHLKSIKASYVY